jgi:glutathione S-transferase
VVTRFLTYDVPLDKVRVAYCKRIMELPAMKEWVAAAKKEGDPNWTRVLIQTNRL